MPRRDFTSQIMVPGTRDRFQESAPERELVKRQIKAGKSPLEIELGNRVEMRIENLGFADTEARSLAREVREAGGKHEAAAAARRSRPGLERIIGDDDLLSSAFLARGARAAECVCCILEGEARIGTGFLVGRRLLITNAHVVLSAENAARCRAEFDFEDAADHSGTEGSVVFRLRPGEFFALSPEEDLDYALVAVEATSLGGSKKLQDYGYLPLNPTVGNALRGECLNIIQHPNGAPKRVALRQNRFTALLERYVHYETDTMPGSSGSPVFNDQWEVVCLHHSGVPLTDSQGRFLTKDNRVWRENEDPGLIHWVGNEGVRISRIVADLARRVGSHRPPILAEFPLPGEMPPNADERLVNGRGPRPVAETPLPRVLHTNRSPQSPPPVIEVPSMNPADRARLSDLASRLTSKDPILAERVDAEFPPLSELAAESALGRDGAADAAQLARETIVVRQGRPVLLVQNDDYVLDGPEVAIWNDRLGRANIRSVIRRVLPAVGRIELDNFRHPWVGTGWLVDDDIIVTNRHVAELFAARNGRRFVFRQGADGTHPVAARVDFMEELNSSAVNEFRLLDVLYIEDEPGPDIAFLKVERNSAAGRRLAGKLALAARPGRRDQFVGTVGYPASDPRIPDQDLVRRLFGDVYDVKRFAPGQLLAPRGEFVLHDCSTLGGNSGSVIMDLESGEAVGLHFAGLFLRENRGVPAAIVRDRLAKLRPGFSRSPKEDEQRRPDEPAGRSADGPGGTRTVSQTVHVQDADGQTLRLSINVPIEISIRVGELATSVQTGTSFGAGSGNDLGAAGHGAIDAAVRTARESVASDSSVLDVRDGYVFRDDWITDQPAVVVVVRDAAQAPDVPKTIGGYPVEIREAEPSDYLESAGLLEVLEGVPTTTYEPPEDVELSEVDEEMRVVCHLCPDAGWPTLRDFLEGTKRRLTVGMYDFTAPHIVKGVRDAVDKAPRKLRLVLQAKASLGGGTKEHDIPEEKTIKNYAARLDERFQHVQASVGKGRRFASAYHIKVAVRDGKAFWLSSGNWQSSNQPDHEIATADDGWDLLMSHNREWNAVIENESLSQMLEAFLVHDFDQAEEDAELEALPSADLEFLVEEAVEEAVPKGPPTYFEPLVVDRRVRVQPLLTPDNYSQHVLRLIKSAKKEILFQNQSFSILDDPKNDARYAKLFDALLAKQQADVDVRIIVRGEFDAQKTVERLKKHGFDTDRIRLQNRCHTKGIIVDRKTVLLGSHNWTNQGALVNRDASLIFRDEEIAEYFAEIFEFDWEKLARPSIRGRRRVRPADDREAPFAGTLASWHELYS